MHTQATRLIMMCWKVTDENCGASASRLPGTVNTEALRRVRNISSAPAGHELINTVVQVGAFKGKQPQQTAH